MNPMLEEARERWRKSQHKEGDPIGYCPCCGAPSYEGDKPQEHDYSCLWYKEGTQ